MSGLAQGRVDRQGRLVEAEPPLARLQESAGARLGQPVAVPQIAMLARLSQRLGLLVSRCVVAADGADNLDLWVEAKPDHEGVKLSVGGWVRRPNQTASSEFLDDVARTRGDWHWETDVAMRVSAIGHAQGEALVGQSLARVFRFIDDGVDLPVLDALAARRSFDAQPAVLRQTGEALRLSGQPLVDGGGRFAGYRGQAFGADEPASAKDDVITAFPDRLERAMRGPLDRIIDQAALIGGKGEGPLRHDYADYAGDIGTAARHLVTVVDGLAELKEVERDDVRPRSDRIDLAGLGARAAALLRVRAAEQQVRIDVASLRPALAIGDEGRVMQILVNLLGNALRHAPAGTDVTLSTAVAGDRARLTISDMGAGIAREDHERVFEKFIRLTSSGGSGSGLGLYIARRLARAMGGDVTVSSTPDQGAQFTLLVPAA